MPWAQGPRPAAESPTQGPPYIIMTDDADILATIARRPLGEVFFAAVSDADEWHAGRSMMLDAIVGRDDDLAGTLLYAIAADQARSPGATDQARGAMAAICECLDALDAGGLGLHVSGDADPLAARALAATGAKRRALLRITPPEHGAAVLELLLMAARAAGPHLKRAAPPPPPAPPPAPVVNVQLALPAGAVPVEIVSQPATRAVQTVERDDDAEIVQTVTETRPLPAGP